MFFNVYDEITKLYIMLADIKLLYLYFFLAKTKKAAAKKGGNEKK